MSRPLQLVTQRPLLFLPTLKRQVSSPLFQDSISDRFISQKQCSARVCKLGIEFNSFGCLKPQTVNIKEQQCASFCHLEQTYKYPQIPLEVFTRLGSTDTTFTHTYIVMESYRGTVRTPKDAILLLEAARLNMIPRVKRRLKDSERRAIRAGDVFIWNEKEAKMRRWTDGRIWSASRVTGAFLTYKEMENSASVNDIDEFNMSNYSYKNDGLIKQSFCITTTKGDKLHLISYSNLSFYADSAQSRPSNDPFFTTIQIPKDLYPTTIVKTEPAQQTMQNPVQQKQQQPKQQQQLTPTKSPLQQPSSPTTQPYATSLAQYQPIQPLPSPAYVPRYQSLPPSPPMTQLPLPPSALQTTLPREVKAYPNDVLALNALDRTF